MISTWPGTFYTSQETFDLERDRIFKRSWTCVGRTDAIPDPGSFLRVEICGESVLVVRGRDGRLRGLLNLCRHRGAQLCVEERGRFGNSIRCMYHGWTYGLDGRMIGAPHMNELPPDTRQERTLHPVATTEWLGYVWLNLDADPPPLEEQLEPQLRERFGESDVLVRYGIEDLRPVTTVTYDVRANWKLIIENFSECYHCSTLHPELSAALPYFRSGYGTVSGRRGAQLAPDRDGFSLSGRAVASRLPGLYEEEDRAFNAANLWPNVVVVLVPDHVAWFRLEPLAPDRTRVVTDWLFHPRSVAEPGFDAGDAVALLDIANRQDFEASERCQLGAGSERFEAAYPPHEHVIGDFHRWVEEALGTVMEGRHGYR
ncbi:aromatic ring-hydroxylating oxygenase subunit alpha [Streptomyces sp. HMX87]|uniref:aromatic ring-hydroxylating oxygenase subunit alpha n=1 Tax=Streptomyces sp. HMX87 TaxID=3390849 RepID=UPI003A856EF1